MPRKPQPPPSLGGLFEEPAAILPAEALPSPPEPLPMPPAPEELQEAAEAVLEAVPELVLEAVPELVLEAVPELVLEAVPELVPEPVPDPEPAVPELTEWQKTQARVQAFMESQVSVTPIDEYGEPVPERVSVCVVVEGKEPDRKRLLLTLEKTMFVWEHNDKTFWQTELTIPEDCWEASAREQAQRVCNKLIIGHLRAIVVAPDRAWSKQVEYAFYLSPDAPSRFMDYEDFERLRRK